MEFEHHIAHRLGELGQRQSTQLQGMGQLDWLSYGSGHVHGVLLNQTPLIHLERDGLHREVGRTLHVLAEQGNTDRNAEHQSIEQARQFDPLGRLLQQSWQGLAASQPLVGGMQGHQHPSVSRLAVRRYNYDGLGQLIGVQTPGDATLYQYDAQQRLIGMTRAEPQGERSQRWRLDAAGNRLPLPSTLMQTSDQPDQPDWSAQVRQNLNNLDFNLLKPEQGGPGANAEVQHWKTNRVEYSTQTDKNGQTRTVHYRYDAHGNRIQATTADGAKMLMHYDALHQLIRVEQFNEDGKVLSTTAYRYDAFGRRLNKTHRVIAQESEQTHYFGWDGDRLVHTEDATLIRHTVYEPGSFVPLLQLQQNKGKKSAAQTLWSMGQEDGSEDGSEDGRKSPPLEAAMPFEDLPRAQRELLQGALDLVMQPGSQAVQGLPVNAQTASLLTQSLATLKVAHDETVKAHPVTVRHYLTDHLGTPIALVDANGDQAGQVTWAASYNAWGDIQEEYNPHNLQQPIRFQGQQLDAETGLHYNRFRYYEPNTGRYLTQDPIGLSGGVNVYAYPWNPAQFIDPWGLSGILTINSSGDGSLLSGHSWITYSPDGGTPTTYGTWGNNPTGKGNGLFTNLEAGKSSDVSRSMHIDDAHEKALLKKIEDYKKAGQDGWKYGAPCSSFARDAWKTGTNENLNSNYGPVSNPSTLKDSILTANGGLPTATATAANGGNSASFGSLGRSSGSSLNSLGSFLK